MEPQELWKPIPGFPDYEASNFGRIRSMRSGWGMRNEPLVLQTVGKNPQVSLQVDGKQKRRAAARLVLMTWGPEPETVMHKYVEFIDLNRNNLHIDNLRWTAHITRLSAASDAQSRIESLLMELGKEVGLTSDQLGEAILEAQMKRDAE